MKQPEPEDGETHEESDERNIRNQEWKTDVAREDAVLERSRPRTVRITLWVIYDHPDEFPDHFVVRRQEISDGGAISFGMAHTFDTLSAARAYVPSGYSCLPRHPDDAPSIVETWI